MEYTLRNGNVANSKDLAALRERARRMYVEDRLASTQIADSVGVTPNTVRKWRKQGAWDALLERAEDMKEKHLLKDLMKEAKVSDLVDSAWVIAGLKNLATTARAESVRLGAIRAVGESLGMFKDADGNKDTQDVIQIIGPGQEGQEAEAQEENSVKEERPEAEAERVEIVSGDAPRQTITHEISSSSPSVEGSNLQS